MIMEKVFKNLSLGMATISFFASANSCCMQDAPEKTTAAMQAIASKSPITQWQGLTAFKILIKNDQAFTPAIEVATNAMRINDFNQQNIAYELFKALFQKNQGFEQATHATCDLLFSDEKSYSHPRNIKIKAAAFKIFEILIEHGYAQEEANKAIEYGMKHSNENMQAGAKKLYQQVVLKMSKL